MSDLVFFFCHLFLITTGCTGVDLNVQDPCTVTRLTAFRFLTQDASKDEGNWTKQLNCFNAQLISYLSTVETITCRFICKMEVKLQKNVQKSVINRLRDSHFYTVQTSMSMQLEIHYLCLFITSIKPNAEWFRSSVLTSLCALVSGVSEKQR